MTSGACSPIGRVEGAAAKNPRPHGREEIRRAGLQREAAQPGHRVDAGYIQGKVPTRPEGNGERQRRVLDSRQRLRLSEQRVPQRDVLERIARHPACIRADIEQPVGVVPHSHVLDVGQAAQEEARADQQHDRERRLRDQQSGAETRPMHHALSHARLERRRDVPPVRSETPERVPSARRRRARARRRRTESRIHKGRRSGIVLAEQQPPHREPAPLRDHQSQRLRRGPPTTDSR